jgi:hypothetical protein
MFSRIFFSYRQICYDKFQQCLFYWRFFARFRPEKNMISTGFFMGKNDLHSPDFEELVSQSPAFYDKSQ